MEIKNSHSSNSFYNLFIKIFLVSHIPSLKIQVYIHEILELTF